MKANSFFYLKFSLTAFVCLFSPCYSLAKKLSTPYDYHSVRYLSDKNVNFFIGIPLLKPPNSWTSSFADHLIFHADYRKENINPYTPPVFLRLQGTVDSSNSLRSLALFPGVRFPGTHRKTPVYFALSLGSEFSLVNRKKLSFYLQFSGIFKIIQLHRKASALIEVNVQYKLKSTKWWQTPSSLNLLTGVDINI